MNKNCKKLSFIVNAHSMPMSDLSPRCIAQAAALLEVAREHVNVEIFECRRPALIAEHLQHVGQLLALLWVLTGGNCRVVRGTWPGTISRMWPSIISCESSQLTPMLQHSQIYLTWLWTLLLRACRCVVARPCIYPATQLGVSRSAR